MMAQRAPTAVAHGALQRLPYVRTASEIQEMKFWRANVRESNRIVDPAKRAKNQTSRLINMQLGKLSSITRQASLDFPALKRMHPFEREVVVLTLGQGTYEKHIQRLRKVYATLHNTGKQFERECLELRTKQEAIDCGLRCIEDLRKTVDNNADTLQEAANMAKMLRGLPHVELNKPIFAFVGAPNVGTWAISNVSIASSVFGLFTRCTKQENLRWYAPCRQLLLRWPTTRLLLEASRWDIFSLKAFRTKLRIPLD
ncbi:hypothetical protein V7S43_012313 [Phytophthora oleae]|uniref:NOG1 N-terminal helical domain-containing protein n=1 Tax=Phytophthora oleae TaxID=2107226 RepID=A0ABD3F9S4_9STRA